MPMDAAICRRRTSETTPRSLNATPQSSTAASPPISDNATSFFMV